MTGHNGAEATLAQHPTRSQPQSPHHPGPAGESVWWQRRSWTGSGDGSEESASLQALQPNQTGAGGRVPSCMSPGTKRAGRPTRTKPRAPPTASVGAIPPEENVDQCVRPRRDDSRAHGVGRTVENAASTLLGALASELGLGGKRLAARTPSGVRAMVDNLSGRCVGLFPPVPTSRFQRVEFAS